MDIAALKQKMEAARRFELTLDDCTYVCVTPTSFDMLAVRTRDNASHVEQFLALVLRVLRDWRGVSIEGEALPCTAEAISLWFADHVDHLITLASEAGKRAQERAGALEAERKN